MKDGVIADYRVTGSDVEILYLQSDGQMEFFQTEVLVSEVGPGVSSIERRAVVEATIKAGATAAYVMKEPILAAIGAGISIQEPIGHMIVDIGGGTTDAAVISFGGIVASASLKCAGDKINQAIADHIKKIFNSIYRRQDGRGYKNKNRFGGFVDEEMVYKIKRDFPHWLAQNGGNYHQRSGQSH